MWQIRDVNGNDMPDVLFSVNWNIDGSTWSEIYLYEWQGTELRPLIEIERIFGFGKQYCVGTKSDRDFVVEDIDGDGVSELFAEDEIWPMWKWDGSLYMPLQDEEP